MVTTVQVEFPEEYRDQYDWLGDVKEKHGMTWKGMLLHAARDLESQGHDADDRDE